MKIKLWEVILLILFGGIMFTSKLLMEWLPNIHLLAMFIALFTLLFRWKALISIYTFVFVTGVYGGFSPWWFQYLYIWTVLWAVIMLLPKKMPTNIMAIACIIICGLHGFAFGILGAPTEAIIRGFSLEATKTYILMGLPFDFVHGISNMIVATLVVPLYIPLKKVISKYK